MALYRVVRHVVASALETRLHLVDVQTSLSVNFSSVRSQENICFCILQQEIGKALGCLEIVVVEQSSSKFGKVVAVNILLCENDRECNAQERVFR